MKLNRETLEEYISKFFVKIHSDKELNRNLVKYLEEKYNYPAVRASDLLSKRIILSEAGDYDLFVLMDGIENIVGTKNKVATYFTDDEIATYSKHKYKKEKKVRFPLKFTMIQIAPDQWIGSTSARELIKLRNAGLIRYNANIQRTMRRGIRGKTQEYRIMENKKTTNEIRESMQAGNFIPNVITLNIPDSLDSDFNYDDETKTLTIKKANSLDIIDGFHRLIALEQAGNMDQSWDYPMELRISNYSESKGQRFVYQEDQKTKMKKIDSDSFNVEDEAVKTVIRLNEDATCAFQGQINRNNGLISMPELSVIVKKMYFNGVGKQEARVLSLKLSRQIKDNLNKLVEFDLGYITKRFEFCELYILFVAFDYFKEKEIADDKQAKIIQYCLNKNNISEDLNKKLHRKSVTYPITKSIIKFVEEGEENV